MFCEKCGSSIPEGSQFCVNCGEAVNHNNSNSNSSTNYNNSYNYNDYTEGQQPTDENQYTNVGNDLYNQGNQGDPSENSIYLYKDTTPSNNIITGESFNSPNNNGYGSNQYSEVNSYSNNSYNGQANNMNNYNNFNQKPVNQESNGFGIAAMVLGIISIVFCWAWFLGPILGILALVFGILQMKKKTGKGMAITGIITGSVAIVLTIIFYVLVVIGVLAEDNYYYDDYDDYLQDYDEFDELYDDFYDDLNSTLGDDFYINM